MNFTIPQKRLLRENDWEAFQAAARQREKERARNRAKNSKKHARVGDRTPITSWNLQEGPKGLIVIGFHSRVGEISSEPIVVAAYKHNNFYFKTSNSSIYEAPERKLDVGSRAEWSQLFAIASRNKIPGGGLEVIVGWADNMPNWLSSRIRSTDSFNAIYMKQQDRR